MFVYYSKTTKEILATRKDGIDLPFLGTLDVDYAKVDIVDYVPGNYTVDDTTTPITLIAI